MNWLRLVFTVAWNDIQVLFKDKGALAIFLLLPLLIAGLINAPQIASWANEEEPAISFNLAVVNEDEGLYGEQVVNALKGIAVLNVTEVAAAETADAQVAEREVEAAVLIPPGFSQQIDAYEPVAMNLIVDPTQEASVGLITGILDSVAAEVNLVGEIRYGIRAVLSESEAFVAADPAMQAGAEAQTLGVIMTQLNEKRTEPVISVASQDMEGKSATELYNITVVAMMPGIGILFSFFVTTALIGSFYAEKDQGSFRRLLAAPLPRSAIIAGKMIATMLVVFLQLGILIVLGNLLFNMPVGDSPLGLFLVILALALSVTAAGMFLTAVSRTQKQANAWAMIASFVLGALGGCLYGIPIPLVFRAEGVLGTISRLTPQGNAMDAIVSIMAEGAVLVDVLPQVATILAITLLLYFLALWRFRFE
jgi:ABC-2 type transport system permease protein